MTTLLAIGDMHLGRLPAGLPDSLAEQRRALGPATAWNAAIDQALERQVDAVLLAGDVVERGRDFFVAYGELKAGVERLAAADIPIIAVAGNHDTHVLPRLAAEIKQLELLGADGQWQRRVLADVEIVGWSFPQAQVRTSPLANFPAIDSDRTLIGLLHCDRDQAGSPYAPVSSSELDAAPVAAWLLGHIHRPDELGKGRPIGYLGSISALRASETGSRGPWLLSISEGKLRFEHLPLAPLRYDRLPVDISELDDAANCPGLVASVAREHLLTLKQRGIVPEAIGLRVVLIGRSAQARHMPAVAQQMIDGAEVWRESGVNCFIDRIDVAVQPALDLARLATQSDPAGLLAQRLLTLRGRDDAARQALLGEHRERLQLLAEGREFRELDRRLDDDAIAEYLERAALLTLSRLLAQREQGR
ncbi:MAG: DNA repair exonuclease [Wenzhouxiangella sp.]|nr:DNA repair exonuclease [Wenzhouxiangella sp.]